MLTLQHKRRVRMQKNILGTIKQHCLKIGVVASLLILLLPSGAQEDFFLKTRLWADFDNTRLVFESTEILNYKVSSFETPPRLVIDILTPKGSIEKFSTDSFNLAADYIDNIRVSRLDQNTLRVVFDLAAGIDYKILRIKPIKKFAHRLVVDLTPLQKEDPLLALIQSLETRPFIVLIDPGHGGEDPGAVSPNNNYEKDIVLKIAKAVAKEINRRRGFRALLSRDHDKFIKLFERVNIAHRVQADTFISIHADSVKSPKARGSSVYVLSEKGATSPHAKRLAREANLSDLMGGEKITDDPALDSMLRALSQDGKKRASDLLAKKVLNNMGKINHLHFKTVEAAGFAVLKSPSIPSILVETAYLSNPQEEKKLLDKKYHQQIAIAIADALEEFKKQIHTE